MNIDGKALAADIGVETAQVVAQMKVKPRLAVFTCAPNFETQKFLMIKERQAAAVGIELTRIELSNIVTLGEVEKQVKAVTATNDGIIIQFPFPHLATADLIPLIPRSHDIDVLTYTETSPILPPVVGAINEMASRAQLLWAGKQVVVVGNGRLVGSPAALYARMQGARVTIITKDSTDLSPLGVADIVILGAGVPGLLKQDMVKDGVVVFDAGTTEEGGALVGDADPAVAAKAALFTPVPGGIGPVTVAILLRNVLYLALEHRKNHTNVV
jgi:methylenetetrahydrofolate dehydrogenase (NADP+) / methenyltetrahydrofolate cyclohydrolase